MDCWGYFPVGLHRARLRFHPAPLKAPWTADIATKTWVNAERTVAATGATQLPDGVFDYATP